MSILKCLSPLFITLCLIYESIIGMNFNISSNLMIRRNEEDASSPTKHDIAALGQSPSQITLDTNPILDS